MKRISISFTILATMLLMNVVGRGQDTTLTVTSAGNVGIGTGSPSEQLHVWENLQVGDPANLWASPSDDRVIKFGDGEFASIGEAGGNDRLRIMGEPISMEGDIVIKGDISMGGLFGILGDFIIDGNVGIGQPSSGRKLEIYDDLAEGPMLLLTNTTASGDVAIDFHSAGIFQANVAYEPTGDYLTINSRNTSNTVLNEAGGNVGIGITSPGQRLSVAGTIESTSGGFKFPDGTIQTSAAAGGGGSVWSTTGSDIFYDSGNVGIGTSAPTLPLEIHGPGNFYEDLGMEFENTTSGQTFVLYNDGTSGEESFNIAQPTEAPSLCIQAAGNPGNVGIGTTSPNYKLHVNGDAAGTSWTNLSSRDYKENITKVSATDHEKMLKELMDVDISTYKYKDEFGGDGTTRIGFVAEEMPEQVLSKDGKGVDVYELLAYTIGAMKAQQKKIEELEARLNQMQ